MTSKRSSLVLTVIAPDIDIGEAKTNQFIPRSINGWSSAPDIRRTAAISHAVSSSNFSSASTFSRSVPSSGLSLSIYSLKTPSQSSNTPSRRTSAASFVNPGPLTIHGSGIDVDGPTNYDSQIPLLTESSGEEENLIAKCDSVVSKSLSGIQFKDIFPINAISQKASEWKTPDKELSLENGNEILTPFTLSKQFEATADNATNIYHDVDHSFINNCFDSGRFCDVEMESQNQIGALCSIIASVNEYKQASQTERTWYSVSTRPKDLEIRTSREDIDDLLATCTDYMGCHHMEQSSKSSSERAICSRIAVTEDHQLRPSSELEQELVSSVPQPTPSRTEPNKDHSMNGHNNDQSFLPDVREANDIMREPIVVADPIPTRRKSRLSKLSWLLGCFPTMRSRKR